MPYIRVGHIPTIRNIPDDLWGEIKLLLPSEKVNNTVGRPVIPFRKVVDGILYVLRTGCQWKMLPKEYGSGSTCHRRFQKLWIKLSKHSDELRGIGLKWQSLDSISVKAPLGGNGGS